MYLSVCPSVRVSSNSLLSTAALHGLDSADQRLNMVRSNSLFIRADASVFVCTCVCMCACVYSIAFVGVCFGICLCVFLCGQVSVNTYI